MRKRYLLEENHLLCITKIIQMTERELIKLEGTIRKKMEDIKKPKVSLKRLRYWWVDEFIKKVE